MVSCKCATFSLREQTRLLILSNASVNWGLSGRALHSRSALMTYERTLSHQTHPERLQRFALRFTILMQPSLQTYSDLSRVLLPGDKWHIQFCMYAMSTTQFALSEFTCCSNCRNENCPQWHEPQATVVPTSLTHTFVTWRGCSARKFQPMQHNKLQQLEKEEDSPWHTLLGDMSSTSNTM